MSETMGMATFAPIEGTDPALPGDPFSRPRYAYGQLLGAEDFTAEQRYHLVRARLRNALLHGSGVVCGLDILSHETADPPAVELRCTAGLAIDALGREIYVPETVCLDLTGLANNAKFWSELTAPEGAPADSKARRCYAVLTYRACLSQQVPAIAQPCSDADNALAWSRVLDSYRLCLEAAPPPDPHPLARDWHALITPAALRARLQALLTNAPPNPAALWSHADEAKVLLATIDLSPVGVPAERTKLDAIDTSVRALLPGVQTVAEMATGLRLVGPMAAAALGLRLMSATVAKGAGTDAGKMVATATFSAPPLAGTVTAASARLFKLDAGAWIQPAAAAPVVAGPTMTLVIGEAWTVPTHWQLVLSGGGAQPIVDAGSRPLAGIEGDPVPLPGQGRDACVFGAFVPT